MVENLMTSWATINFSRILPHKEVRDLPVSGMLNEQSTRTLFSGTSKNGNLKVTAHTKPLILKQINI
jgi:hypothetical protein